MVNNEEDTCLLDFYFSICLYCILLIFVYF